MSRFLKSIILLLLSGGLCFAQETISVKWENEFYGKIVLPTSESFNIHSKKPFTAFSAEASNEQNLNQIEFFHSGAWRKLYLDEHNEGRLISEPVILKEPLTDLNFRAGNVSGQVIIHLIQAPPLFVSAMKLQKTSDNCSKPLTISYTIWRAGLPDPKAGREVTQVKHCIVHHAASSNFNHNYTDVVRNIYLLHTQTNMWDDIGYNYLVAQDGTIFSGRDPQGFADEDNILGAHFCSKNTGTMGICLLGNYMDTIPTDLAIASLEKLLSWKMFKERLQTTDSSIHPSVSGTEYLPTIAGHRNGCNTSCPGDFLYTRFDSIRATVQKHLDACEQVASLVPPEFEKPQIFINEHGLNVSWPNHMPAQILVSDLWGRLIYQGVIHEDEFIETDHATIYLIRLNHRDIYHFDKGKFRICPQ